MSLPVLSRSFVACRIGLAAISLGRSTSGPFPIRRRPGRAEGSAPRGESGGDSAPATPETAPPRDEPASASARRGERDGTRPREDGPDAGDRRDPYRAPTGAPRRQASASSGRVHPLRVPARQTRPLEPILFPKLRIHFADFPYLHCSIDQRLLTLETCCGYEYDRRRESFAPSGFQGPSRAHRTPQDVWRFTGRRTLSPGKPIPG